jgi:hypothetical protein
MEQAVQEYFKNYFGGTLNESTDEEIMEAVYDLIDLTEAVLEAVALPSKKRIKDIGRVADRYKERGRVAQKNLRNQELVADDPKFQSPRHQNQIRSRIDKTKADINKMGAREDSARMGAATRNLARVHGQPLFGK